MLHTIPTYTYRTEAGLPPSPSPKGEGSFVASEPLLRTMGGNASGLILGDYDKLHSLLQALCVSVGSRLFPYIYTSNNNQLIPKTK